jgi:hypothetical protein
MSVANDAEPVGRSNHCSDFRRLLRRCALRCSHALAGKDLCRQFVVLEWADWHGARLESLANALPR